MDARDSAKNDRLITASKQLREQARETVAHARETIAHSKALTRLSEWRVYAPLSKRSAG
jgi:hypothetical protein